MKKWLIALSLLAVFTFSVPAYSQDVPAAEQPAAAATGEKPVPEPTRTVPVTPVTIDVKKAPEPKAEESSVMDAVKSIVVIILGIIGAGLSLVGTVLVVKLLQKAGININADTEKSIRKIVDSGIRRVEVWAAAEEKQNGKKPKPTSKLQKGIEKIDKMLTAFGIKKMAAAKIEELIEERLEAKNEKKAKANK